MYVLNSVPNDVKELIKSGHAKIYGGVVRRINTPGQNGQIVRILQFPTDNLNSITNELASLDARFSNSEKVLSLLNENLSVTNLLAQANLITSGLNLCVSAAGFALVLNKLNKVNKELNKILAGIDLLTNIAMEKEFQELLVLINSANVNLQRFKLFEEEQFTSDNYDSLLDLIGKIRVKLISLINSQIPIEPEYIFMLYDSYLSLNKLIIYQLNSINKLDGYTELENVKIVIDLINNSIVDDYVYKTMFLSTDKIYLESEIYECIQYFKLLLDYNYECLDSQHKLFLEDTTEYLA